MSEQKLTLGIIGMGRVAMAHAEAARELKEQVDLVAIAEPRAERAKEMAETFGVKKIYLDYRELLKDPEIEAVIICLPNHLHHPVCLEAARAGKHILVEKPMCMNLAEADEMISKANKHEITFMVGQCRRFSFAMQEIFNRIDEIGQPFRIDIAFLVHFHQPPTDWWKSSEKAGGLVILLQGSHSVDTVLWLLKKVPSSVVAFSQSQNSLWEGEDEADIILKFDTGELASIHLSLNVSPYLHELLISGPKGSLKLFEYPTEKTYGFRYRLELNEKIILEGEQIPSLYTIQLKEFAEAIKENRQPIASAQEVRKTMMVLDEIRRSDSEGTVVHLNSSIK
ncbi:MAG: Gfo/Idh/MocA family oxidoreductase [Desulfobacteraceae bacterium]|nr:MAG: Gfo/Idh/MocA family oxidoreductase [Desulfobacteraceae bacterium]